MKVLIVASEAAPFAKTGGLADVAGSLPSGLLKLGIDARVILPLYGVISEEYKKKMHYINNFYVKVGSCDEYCGIFEYNYNGVTFYFLDNEYYFKRDGLYGYLDDAKRYGFFCRAVLNSLQYIDFKPDILHCNDWQSGMVPVLLESGYRNNSIYSNIQTLFTIHNLRYQGVFSSTILNDILNLGLEYYTCDKLEFNGAVSFMKGGLVYSKLINTVSIAYANEIQYPYYGEGLDGLLRARSQSLYGILNGIDYDEYDPSKDKLIFKNYNKADILNKKENKKQLQEMLGLDINPDIPMVGIVSRLVDQKGFDLIECVFSEIMNLDIQLVVLGTGDYKYEKMFRDSTHIYTGKVSANIKFDNTLAHKIYAGVDMFLMPSLFEPCGLGQLIALRYGTIPIVRETGGLKDTVRAFDEFKMEGNGFSFLNYNAHDMLYTIDRAVKLYHNKDYWKVIIKNAMNSDYSLDNSARNYFDLYNKLLQ